LYADVLAACERIWQFKTRGGDMDKLKNVIRYVITSPWAT
jgi:hypothetical protein